MGDFLRNTADFIERTPFEVLIIFAVAIITIIVIIVLIIVLNKKKHKMLKAQAQTPVKAKREEHKDLDEEIQALAIVPKKEEPKVKVPDTNVYTYDIIEATEERNVVEDPDDYKIAAAREMVNQTPVPVAEEKPVVAPEPVPVALKPAPVQPPVEILEAKPAPTVVQPVAPTPVPTPKPAPAPVPNTVPPQASANVQPKYEVPELTEFEKAQEEQAIISYEELINKKEHKIVEINDGTTPPLATKIDTVPERDIRPIVVEKRVLSNNEEPVHHSDLDKTKEIKATQFLNDLKNFRKTLE